MQAEKRYWDTTVTAKLRVNQEVRVHSIGHVDHLEVGTINEIHPTKEGALVVVTTKNGIQNHCSERLEILDNYKDRMKYNMTLDELKRKAKEDYWYFFNHLVKLQSTQQPLSYTDNQKRMIDYHFKGKHTIHNYPRQTGVTTISILLMLYEVIVNSKSSTLWSFSFNDSISILQWRQLLYLDHPVLTTTEYNHYLNSQLNFTWGSPDLEDEIIFIDSPYVNLDKLKDNTHKKQIMITLTDLSEHNIPVMLNTLIKGDRFIYFKD